MRIHKLLKSSLVPVGMTLLLASAARAADTYNPIPLTTGSFTADMVVEKTAQPPIEHYVTAGLDGGTNLTGNGWFETGYYPAMPGWGLPPHGTTFAAQYNQDGTLGPDNNHVYAMAPDYTTNNALFLSRNNGPSAGSLTITNPGVFMGLSIVNCSGNGGETIGYTVHHQDATTEAGTFVSADWFHGNGSAPYPVWMTHCLIGIEGNNLQQIGGGNGDLYFNDISLTNSSGVYNTSPVVSIDFTNMGGGGNGRMGLFAISGSSDDVAYNIPLGLSGFNRDLVVETNALNFSMNVGYCTATMERGIQLWGQVYMEQGFGGQNAAYGFPPAGSTFTNSAADHAFIMAPNYTLPNAMLVAGTGYGPNGGTWTLTTPHTYEAVSILCAATWGPKIIDVTVHHADSSSETFTGVSVPDWYNVNGTIAGTYPATLGLATAIGFQVDNTSFIGAGNVSNHRLFAVDITLGNQSSPVTSVDMALSPENAPGSPSYVVFVFGLAGKTGTSTPAFMPAPVTGYNADMIVEKAAILHPHGLYNATTASMDGGTNNTGNTWYEQGYYKQFPASGLPPAGSTVHSIAQPNSYVMPSSYTANNAAYIDSSHTTANLAPVTPGAYTALSFLSSDANSWVSNRVVMQYQDGTSDTNYFVSQDWFGVSPYAFSSQGRVNLDNPAINNDPGHNQNQNPRLYEAQVGLNNTTSPLTNVALTFLSGSGGNSRMAVFGMSGATGIYPVIIRGIPANVGPILEGTTARFSTYIAGGATPISYNWQIQSNGVWLNLVDGVAGVSGSTTLTNTIATYPGWMTNYGSPANGAYSIRMAASNSMGTVFSSVATMTLRSGYPDLPIAGDPVSGFGASTGDAGPPGNIDHLVGGNPDVKCLWTANANVGFITTPSVGSSIVRALRLYWANDADVRDPATFILEGSNDGGTTWATIVPQTGVTHNTARNGAASVAPNPLVHAMQEFDFYGNNVAYTSYRVTFPTVFSTTGNTLTQIGEVELLGVSLNTAPPFFVVQPPATEKVFVGASPVFSVVAGGAPTLQYQWYSNNVPVSGATAATFKLANAQVANSGNQIYCNVHNINGTTNSSVVALTVVPRPTQAYPVAVLNNNPTAYYRLDEGPDDSAGNNGAVANDYIGGFFGTYNNSTLAVPGYNPGLDSDTAAQFGFFSTADGYVNVNGLNFATPAGSNVAFSVEAWVQGSSAQTTDAGILTIGYGGFEQFNLDCGGAGHNFRFYVRDAAGVTHGQAGTKSAEDLRWHHLVGVCDTAHSNVVLYVDGIPSATTSGFNSGLGILAPTTPLSIGARRQNTTTGYDFQFLGSIDEVAVFNAALTPSQVLAHYYAADPAPVFTVQPTNTIVGESATLKLYSSAYGPGTITYQWYQSTDSGGTFNPMGGQTSSNLTIANISATLDQSYYYVVANNAYGSVTSSVPGYPGTLVTVRSGPPAIDADVPPSEVMVAGGILNLQVTAYGTPPLTYQWQSTPDNGGTWNNLSNGGRISGATSNVLTIANLNILDSLGYRVIITNTLSLGAPTVGNMDAITVLPYVAFNTNGFGWQTQGSIPPFIANNALTLTDGGQSQNGSAYFKTPVAVGSPFVASFTYQDVGGFAGANADGACFVMHNDSRGASVLNGGGGSFGIAGVQPSAELEINIYPPANGGEGIAFNANGNTGNYGGQPNTATAPVVLDTGHHINFVVTYAHNTVFVTLTDTDSPASFSTSYSLDPLVTDLATLAGGNTAYVGFSGADGGTTSYQKISNFTMVSLPSLTARKVGPTTVALSWPVTIGSFVLQSKPNLASGTWQNVGATVSLVNGQYEVTVTSTGNQFYRLMLQ